MNIEHVHFYVEDALAWRDWFVSHLGFQAVADYTIPLEESFHTCTEVVKSGSVYFLLSSPLLPISPVAEFLRQHPPGVADIAFGVEDVEAAIALASAHGAKVLQTIQQHQQGAVKVKWGKISGWGGLSHTLIEMATDDLTDVTDDLTVGLTVKSSATSATTLATDDLTDVTDNLTVGLTVKSSATSATTLATDDLTDVTDDLTVGLTVKSSATSATTLATDDLTDVTDDLTVGLTVKSSATSATTSVAASATSATTSVAASATSATTSVAASATSATTSVATSVATITAIDHIVLNVASGDLESAVTWYESILDFQRQQTFTIKTDRSGLYSQVIVSRNAKVQLPINEPASANSQIQEFLNVNNGSGIQHIALRTDNIINAIAQFRACGLSFLRVPTRYYSDLVHRGGLPLSAQEISAIARAEILVDWNQETPQNMHVGAQDAVPLLLQIFTQPIFEQPTFFFEFIERRSQVQGFGEGNFRALFEAIEREQIKRST